MTKTPWQEPCVACGRVPKDDEPAAIVIGKCPCTDFLLCSTCKWWIVAQGTA